MKEEFLHLVWESGLFSPLDLQTTDNRTITIIQKGELNHGAGPDFSSARIAIDGIDWAGTVEIHLRSSDWIRHNHTNDPNYKSVVLHVVFEHDKEIELREGEFIPTLELKGRISSTLYQRYERLALQSARIPCEPYLENIPDELWNETIDRMVNQRLERKCDDIGLLYRTNNGDWSQTYYAMILSFLGQNTNKLPMLELARKVPLNILLKHEDNQKSLEAIVLGAAGFLDGNSDSYSLELESEYSHFRSLYDLSEVAQKWKMGRVRPENSPLRRIIQFTALIPILKEAWEQLILGNPFDFSSAESQASSYWERNYSFTTPSQRTLDLRFSQRMNDILQINVHAPLIYFYAQQVGLPELKAKALDLVQEQEAESNRYTKMWTKIGRKTSTAFDSQGMLELYTQLCSSKKCVNCSIGKSILTRT